MNRKSAWLLILFSLAYVHLAKAQRPAKIARVDVLSSASRELLSAFDPFRQGLRDLGYIDGKNIGIEYRFAEGLRLTCWQERTR